ncbi:sensor domain-containing diguanylate cyclase [Oceanobacillus bengalensis]|uniref:Diguanylate cyclase n=1 Tax=Oceanobacillus bengalensis TaxID=1435466 RepID=A0A494YSU8_9BACI|nr:sensor domain-containing diguanylate cyclase [Oceanobacillus bengalensis]RKQ13200.1 diguanylate cyclase [Oceanobacillus bengalensis]
MWIVVAVIIIGLLLVSIKLYNEKIKLQRQVDYLKPMVETVENVRDILYYCETKPTLNYLYLSPTVNDLIGPETLEEHLQNPEKIFEIVHPEDYDTLMKKTLGQLDFSEPIKVRFRNDQGQYMWYEEYATPVYEKGEYIAVQGIFRNIDERVSLHQQLEYKISHDALTDIHNREYFQSKLNYFNQDWDIPIAVIVADLDDLKFINDNYGHHMGDCFIQEAANRLKMYADEETIVARIGGDEFAILLANASIPKVEQFLKKVQAQMNLYHDDTQLKRINISIGYAYSSSSKGVMEQLLREADTLMYQEKREKKQLISGG